MVSGRAGPPRVYEEPVLTETAGVINYPVSSGYCAMADSSSGLRAGESGRWEET